MDWLYLGLGTVFGASLIGSSFLTNILLAWLIWELRKIRKQRINNFSYQEINLSKSLLSFSNAPSQSFIFSCL